MFTRLDDILYPNKVEVIFFEDHDKYIYPIFKNGSTAIKRTQKEKGYRSLINEQIRKIDNVDVFLRNPKERYISGFQTYIHNNINLDYQTIFQLGQQGYILDRHYLPQINWLVNLVRYMSSTAKIHIHHLEMLDHFAPGRDPVVKSTVDVPFNIYTDLLLKLDHIIWADMSAQSWTPEELFQKLLVDDAMTYSTVIAKSRKLAGVIDVLPKI